MNCFMEEFYPGESSNASPTEFDLYHYNGLSRLCKDGKVRSRSLQ